MNGASLAWGDRKPAKKQTFIMRTPATAFCMDIRGQRDFGDMLETPDLLRQSAIQSLLAIRSGPPKQPGPDFLT